MKKKILALVLSVALVASSVPFFAFAANVDVLNTDNTTTLNYEYDEELFDKSEDKDGHTILIRKEDNYIFYPDTPGNNGLNSAKVEDIVQADGNGLETDKSVTQYPIHPYGNYTITLEAFTTGDVTVEQAVIPTDIVLVLDQSGSMYDKFDDTDTKVERETRQYAMKEAVNSFIDSVYTSATTESVKNPDGSNSTVQLNPDEYVDHRIAIVTYENRTHIMSGNNETTGAFQTVSSDKDVLKQTITDLPKTLKEAEDELLQGNEQNLQTATHLGMTEANDILADDAKVQAALNNLNVEEQRNTVVILFSDGVPAKSGNITYNGNTYNDTKWYVFTENSAHIAINEAYETKNTYNASVFSIGIVNKANANTISGAIDADGEQITSVNTTWNNTAYSSQGNIAAINRFFNFLSSNSDNAQDLGAVPTGRNKNNQIEGWKITDEYNWEEKGFYKTADKAGDLKTIFETIANNVSSISVDLPATTQVHDYVSEYFQLPANFDPNSVKVYEVKCTGGEEIPGTDGEVVSTKYTWDETIDDDDLLKSEDGIKIVYVETPTGVNEGITVEGFDFNKNFVSTTDKNGNNAPFADGGDYGSKLIIQFNVEATDGFIGGNDVITNTSSSGVYKPTTSEDGTTTYDPVDTFTPPDTNVIVKYDITTNDQTIYLGNQIMLYKILELDNHTVSGILNEFVNIQFSIYDDGALDPETGDFKQTLNVNGTEKTVFKDADRYYYITKDADGNDVKNYTDTGGNYEVDGDKLYYVTVGDDGEEVKREIAIETGGYYYLGENDTHERLTDEQAADYIYITKATFFIPAGLSAEQASGLAINSNQSILPAECTDYDLRCFAVPNDENDSSQAYLAEQLNQESTSITVHVLQPMVNANTIYVDYGAQVNIREDGVSPIDWSGINHANENIEDDLFNANAPYAPTVYYIYQNKVTNEYFKSPYKVDWDNDGHYDADEVGTTSTVNPEIIGETYKQTTWDGIEIEYTIVEDLDINIESEEEYEIVAIQTMSSEGNKNIAFWSCESEVYKNLTIDGVSVTDDNDIYIHINKYDVDITKTVTTTESQWATYPQSFIFEVSQTPYDYIEDLPEGTEPDDVVYDTANNPHDIKYREPNTSEVIMMPNEFIKSENPNSDGTYNYTYTKTVSDLYAGLDTKIQEDEDWSWRYSLTDTNVDTIITEGTTLTDEVILIEDVTLEKELEVTAYSTLAKGSLLKEGTSGNITIPEGSQIATDVVIQTGETNHAVNLDIYLSEDVTIAGDSILKAGSVLNAGTTFAAGTSITTANFNEQGKIYYIDANGDELFFDFSTYPLDTYTTQGDITLVYDETLVGDVTVSNGTVIKEGSLLMAGNQLADGTRIPAGSKISHNTDIPSNITLSIGVVLSDDIEVSSGTKLARGTILATGTVLPTDINIERYGNITEDIVDDVITVNYSHNLWVTGYEHDEMGLDNNRNGVNDTLTDINGDGVPDVEAFVYRDRNNDGYVDIDVLAPYVSQEEATANDFTKCDIPFDLDNDGFIDMLVNAQGEVDGLREISVSMSKVTKNLFVGFYVNADGNIVTEDGKIIINNRNKYFDGYYVYNTSNTEDPNYGLITGGNGDIYSIADTEMIKDLSGTKDFYIISASGVDKNGKKLDGIGVSDVVIEDANGKKYIGTGCVILADRNGEDLDIFNRDNKNNATGEFANVTDDALPLYIRDTYRYINSNEYIVFTGEYDQAGDGLGDAPMDGQIDTYFTNELTNEKWLSHDEVKVNEFNNLKVLGGTTNE